MGKPKFSKKKYETPNHPWKETRIKAENELVAKYGLKNKREIWKAETTLRNYRGQARALLAKIDSDDPQTKKELKQLISHLTRYNILPLNSTLDDVLALQTESILSRRLQTLTYLKGFASTPKQARQLINHGHIAIAGHCVNVPGYRVSKDEEKDIEYTDDSPLNDSAHPARPSGDFVSKITDDAKPPKTIDKEPTKDIKKEKKSEKESKDEQQKDKPQKETEPSNKEKQDTSKGTTNEKLQPETSSESSPVKEKQEKPTTESKDKETSSQEKGNEKKPEKKGSDA